MKSFREYTEEHILEFDYPEEKPFAYNLWVGKGAQPSIHQVRTRMAKYFKDYQDSKGKKPLDHDAKENILVWAWHHKKIKFTDANGREAKAWLKKNVLNKNNFNKLKD